MWNFLDRLIATALPRVRDFRGVPNGSFDGRGNYTLGVRDHLIFPDLDYDKVDRSKGLNITICCVSWECPLLSADPALLLNRLQGD